MKKLILSIFLIFGMMGFSARFIKRCEITSKGTYKNGINYVNCISQETGRHFNFTGMPYSKLNKFEAGETYWIDFNGKGYKNLKIIDFILL